jgi:hypothetical protein
MSSRVGICLLKTLKKNFTSRVGSVLYIPNKKLIFINHEKHGKVCPLYLADPEYNQKNNPKKIMPLIVSFTSLNAFFILTGYGYLPMTGLYRMFFYNEYFFYASFIINALGLRKYFKYLTDYTNRVKSMYLKPSGESIILETFNGAIYRFNNLDIYDRHIVSKYESNYTRDSIYTNNENSFFARIGWGMNMEHVFQGKRIYLNHEVFNFVVHRYKIDTTQSKFVDEPLRFWTSEQKKKVLARYRKVRIIPRRIKLDNFNALYYYLKNKSSKRKRLAKKPSPVLNLY